MTAQLPPERLPKPERTIKQRYQAAETQKA